MIYCIFDIETDSKNVDDANLKWVGYYSYTEKKYMFINTLIESELFLYLILPLMIFFARIVDQSIGICYCHDSTRRWLSGR